MTRADYILLGIALFFVIVVFPHGCAMQRTLQWSETVSPLRGPR